jgi:hypothetical protein
MQPASKFDGVQVSSMRAETFHGFQHVLDVIYHMIKATWLGVLLANIRERLVLRLS